jgi:hypothetical protein
MSNIHDIEKRMADLADSRIARIKARNEAVVACADSSREEVDKALERLALINMPKEKTKKGMGIGKVACTRDCGTKMKWSLMDNVQVWDVDPSTIPEEELIVVDVHWHWDRFCRECRAKEWGCSVGEAQERILSKGGYSDLKRRRLQEFQDAVQNVQDFFEMALALQGIEMRPKEKRQCEKIARQSLLKVFPEEELIVVDVHWHWDRFCWECRAKQKRQVESIARQLLSKVLSDMLGVIRKRSKPDEADLAEQQRLLGLLSKEIDADVRGEIIQRIDALNSSALTR